MTKSRLFIEETAFLFGRQKNTYHNVRDDDLERFATIQILVLSRNNTDGNGSADIKRHFRQCAFSRISLTFKRFRVRSRRGIRLALYSGSKRVRVSPKTDVATGA